MEALISQSLRLSSPGQLKLVALKQGLDHAICRRPIEPTFYFNQLLNQSREGSLDMIIFHHINTQNLLVLVGRGLICCLIFGRCGRSWFHIYTSQYLIFPLHEKSGLFGFWEIDNLIVTAE